MFCRFFVNGCLLRYLVEAMVYDKRLQQEGPFANAYIFFDVCSERSDHNRNRRPQIQNEKDNRSQRTSITFVKQLHPQTHQSLNIKEYLSISERLFLLQPFITDYSLHEIPQQTAVNKKPTKHLRHTYSTKQLSFCNDQTVPPQLL